MGWRMAVGTVRKRKTLAAIATGTALMIVAQLATVFSMTVLSALGECVSTTAPLAA